MTIPQEAIEAAAEAINKFAAKYVGVLDPVALKDMSLLDREHALGEARAALEAAAPYIQAKALEDAADELSVKRLLPKPFNEYYPEWLRVRAERLRSRNNN